MRLMGLMLAMGVTVAIAAAAADPFDTTISDVGLLQIKSVQTELKISQAQRDKMNKHAAAHQAALKAYQAEVEKKKMDPQQAMQSARMAKIFNDLKKGVIGELSAAQLKRLREITLQRAGIVAIGQDAVGKRVGLNDAQLKKFRATFETDFKKAAQIRDNAVKAALKEFEGKQPKSEAEAKALNEKVQKKLATVQQKLAPQLNSLAKQTESKLVALLTAQQRKNWAALQGAPFKG